MRHKLYLQIYFAFIGGLLLFALLGGLAWHTLSEGEEPARYKAGISLLVAEALPANQPAESLQQTLQKLAATIDVRLSLYSIDGQHIASSTTPLPLPKQRRDDGWDPQTRGFTLRLYDGRWLVASHPGSHFPGPLVGVLLLLVILGMAAYPVTRRLTCRLEQLQQQVDAFGQGNLKARAKVRGKDEIATLATRFNHAAEQTERLIESQQQVLRGASHELRSPLTRMRMAIELMNADDVATTQKKLATYIAELDDLVDELLLASRLDAGSAVKPFESIDLLALAAEVSSRYKVDVSGESLNISGDETMLRRLLRNLLENASRYTVQAPVRLRIYRQEEQAIIRVCDDGPGIPESDRERVFEPFFQGRIEPGQHHGSAGLGLSLVKKIARQHHGDVHYVDKPDQGTCFEVTLPLQHR